MLYSEMLKHYTKEYEKFVEMGLSKEDALTLVEKHIKADTNIKKASPYDLINLFAGEDIWKNTFDAYQKELNDLLDKVTNLFYKEDEKVSNVVDSVPKKTEENKTCACSEVKKEEVKSCECTKKDGVTEIIANTPKHKEFRVTYPNGYYKYKMLVK